MDRKGTGSVGLQEGDDKHKEKLMERLEWLVKWNGW